MSNQRRNNTKRFTVKPRNWRARNSPKFIIPKSKAKRRPGMGRTGRNRPSANFIPVSKTQTYINRAPSYRTTGRDSITVSHREFISKISSSAADQNSFIIQPPIHLNPGLQDSFPWAAVTANNYESYIMTRFVVEFKPQRPTSTPGQIAMFIDYDAADEPPSSELVFKNSANATTTNVYNPLTLRSGASQLQKGIKMKYTRNSPKLGQDIKTFDFGNLYIATTGVGANQVIGDLYFNYSVMFFTPQLLDLSSQNLIPDEEIYTRLGTTNNPLGDADFVGDQIITKTEAVGGSTLTFNRDGYYLLNLAAKCGTALQNYAFQGTVSYNLLVGLLAPTALSIYNTLRIRALAGQNLRIAMNPANQELTYSSALVDEIPQAIYDHLVLDFGAPIQ